MRFHSFNDEHFTHHIVMSLAAIHQHETVDNRTSMVAMWEINIPIEWGMYWNE